MNEPRTFVQRLGQEARIIWAITAKDMVDAIKNHEIDLFINTPLGQRSRYDEYAIGRSAIKYRVPLITTLSAAEAIVRGLRRYKKKPLDYKCLQDYYRG